MQYTYFNFIILNFFKSEAFLKLGQFRPHVRLCFNSKDFLDTKKYPKAKFVGKIIDLTSVNFNKNGTYNATATGDLTIKNVTKTITEKGTILVENGNSTAVENVHHYPSHVRIIHEPYRGAYQARNTGVRWRSSAQITGIPVRGCASCTPLACAYIAQ